MKQAGKLNLEYSTTKKITDIIEAANLFKSALTLISIGVALVVSCISYLVGVLDIISTYTG